MATTVLRVWLCTQSLPRTPERLCLLSHSHSIFSLGTQGSMVKKCKRVHPAPLACLSKGRPRGCQSHCPCVFRPVGSSPIPQARLRVTGECGFFPLVKSLDQKCAQYPPATALLFSQLCWADKRVPVDSTSLWWGCPPLLLPSGCSGADGVAPMTR